MIINPAQTTESIIKFIRQSFQNSGLTRGVIGVSGGVDSATSCTLAVQALGKENIFPILMPYGLNGMQSTIDAMNFVQSIGIPLANITRIDIKPAVEVLVGALGSVDNLRRGNMMARARMIVLFDQAKKRQALVVGTENKSEHLLGYFTRFGDEASDIEPLRHLYKTQVYELAKFLNIPESILTKVPTADLWFGQTDEGEFGFSYKDADEIMSLLYDQNKTEAEIIKLGISAEIVHQVKKRVDENSFKHHLPLIFPHS